MRETLSVVVPVYNSESYISRCIESILRQTYIFFEILIVDDGSTDDSYHLCMQYADCDDRIKLVHQVHKGVSYTRKTAINMAAGEYIIFVDSDDWIEHKYFEVIMNNIDSMDALIMGHYAGSEKKLQISSIAEGIYTENSLEVIWRSLFKSFESGGILGVLWNKVFRTSLVKKAAVNVPDRLYISEDRCIGTWALLMAEKIKVLNIGGYHYCKNINSITNCVHRDYLYNEHLYYQTMLHMINEHSFKTELLKELDKNMVTRLPMMLSMLGIPLDEFWYYPYYGRLISARIILYGAGKVGRSYHDSIIRDGESTIVAWVDKDYLAYRKRGMNVTSPSGISSIEYDYIIIAVQSERAAGEIKRKLMCMGVLEDCILWNRTRYAIV